MLKLNKAEYLDKLHACWLGKNIGGTMGAPYEGVRSDLDISGFATDFGAPLPNDDLDLQLVWLCAMEDVGAERLNANVLAEYWLDWIPPHWNEYGICKTNLRLGLLPPMSGELDNEKWKTSNGAWIRSEIWAALAPGMPDVAIKYAVCDAMVDHGVSEGTCAEIFTASLQSLAYIESDIRKLIESALQKIPEDSMTYKTIRLATDCYDKGIDYREARKQVVEFNSSLGWFQAPGNLGFVTIGLLYGEGDFKKSLIYAINCGDDTDCTGATVGATLGIIGGTGAIPSELSDHIGDSIVTVSINGMYYPRIPKTCSDLTARVCALVPSVAKANRVLFAFTDGETAYPQGEAAAYNKLTSHDLMDRAPYSFDITFYRPFTARVELNDTPRVSSGDERRVTITFFCNPEIAESRKLQLRLILPDSWSAGKYDKTVSLLYPQPIHGLYGFAKTEFTITVGEQVGTINRAYVEVTCPTLPYPVVIPISFIG
ncbi:MAG: ADP-ribosylglycohydrolase family protein [Clostridia bacterium]|nr:ADP-ribosylglycohydrolase family protein [Clostridia bacterium]